nr:uncharacterized protein LOC123747003 isoform X2 [Procambarus clarkii]
MEEQVHNIFKQEEDLEEPVPVQELQQLEEETRIATSVFRHVEHQQAVEQMASVAALHPKPDLLRGTKEEPGHSPVFSALLQRIPSLPHSAVGSEGSGSVLQLHYSGTGSTEAGDVGGRGETLEDLLTMPPSLDAALKLNMSLQRNYRESIQALERVLQDNITRQEQLKEEVREARYTSYTAEDDQKWDGTGKPPMRISHFCVPYFKNRSGMNAPKNIDAKWKVDNGYLDLYTTRTRPWMITERETLEKVVLQEWKEQQGRVWHSKLRELQRKQRNLASDSDDYLVKALENEIDQCKNFIDSLNKTPPESFTPKLGAKMDWEKIAALAFDGHRSSEECQLIWENLLHPDINCSPWTEEEDLTLQEAVLNCRFKKPDWEAIAKLLKSNRTPFLAMQRWVSFIDPTLHPARWNPEATQKLIDTVNMLRIGNHIPWAQVHQHMVGFSRTQVQSRWRLINPEQSKGPFTVEEDFILIKGLHMFGLNFANITHFMPGRSVAQVRERFKRTILSGLTTKPWTRAEDDILIRECKVGPKNWRRMIMLLPRRNACQIRSRYHTIQVWQTLTDNNMEPPPLFPVSMTVDSNLIWEIRKNMILETNCVKEMVDKSRKGMNVKNVVKELENRRLVIQARKANRSVERMKRATERRGRRPGIPNPHFVSLQDLLLIEFFIPGRSYQTDFSHTFSSIRENLILLCKFFQLRTLREVTPSEKVVVTVFHLKSDDLDVVQELITKHTHSEEIEYSAECEACLASRPESIPLIPANQTTLGALASLLHHRPKLIEMATRKFIFYRATKSELLRLGPDPKVKTLQRLSMPPVMPLVDRDPHTQRHDPSSIADQNLKDQAVNDGSRLQWEVQPECLPGPSGWQPMEASEAESQDESDAPGGRSDTETSKTQMIARTGERSPLKIHITSLAMNSEGKKYAPKKRKCSLYAETRGQTVITTYPRGKAKTGRVVSGDEPAVAAVLDTKPTGPETLDTLPAAAAGHNSEPSQQTAPSLTPLKTAQGQSQEKQHQPRRLLKDEEAREHSENLLFHRMLSIFYYPALMTIVRPPWERILQTEWMLSEGEGTKTKTHNNKPKKSMLTKDELDIEEQEEYIRRLAEEDKKYRALMKYQRRLRTLSTNSSPERKPDSLESMETENIPASIHDSSMGNLAKKRKEAKELADHQSEEAQASLEEVDATPTVCPRGRGRGQGRGRGRGRGRGSGSGRPKRGCGRPLGRPRIRPLEVPPSPELVAENLEVLSIPPGEYTGVSTFRRKENLKSLRRSLVMKKIWEGRRNGSLPPRTSNRDKRNYNPRGSRTRDRVRKELIKPPKTPNPWDLPLDGPMRVQPQVPLNQEILQAKSHSLLVKPQSSSNQASSSHQNVKS